MFDIGFSELLLIAVVALVVMGPQRLPQAMRTLALWLGRARQMFNNLRRELDHEIGMDEVRRQLHNEQILRELKSTAHDIESLPGVAETSAAPEARDSSSGNPDPQQPSQEPPRP